MDWKGNLIYLSDTHDKCDAHLCQMEYQTMACPLYCILRATRTLFCCRMCENISVNIVQRKVFTGQLLERHHSDVLISQINSQKIMCVVLCHISHAYLILSFHDMNNARIGFQDFTKDAKIHGCSKTILISRWFPFESTMRLCLLALWRKSKTSWALRRNMRYNESTTISPLLLHAARPETNQN